MKAIVYQRVSYGQGVTDMASFGSFQDNVGVTFYAANVLRALPYWGVLINAQVQGNYIVIQPGGQAGVNLSNDYFDGLMASKYREVRMSVDVTGNTQALNNYQNLLSMYVVGTYNSESEQGEGGGPLKVFTAVGFTGRGAVPMSNGAYQISRLLRFDGYDFQSLSVYLVNNTDYPVTIQNCMMMRSQDVSSSQIGSAIGWGMTLSEVKAFNDGCHLYFETQAEPTKLKYLQDSFGNFSGVEVNGDRVVKFSRIAEDMP